MNAYIYQAALLCEDCARERIVLLHEFGQSYTEESDKWPQGPYANGGGEADSPQHCDHCGVFLENPLTSDGVEYVMHVCGLAEYCHVGLNPIRDTWREFYADVLKD